MRIGIKMKILLILIIFSTQIFGQLFSSTTMPKLSVESKELGTLANSETNASDSLLLTHLTGMMSIRIDSVKVGDSSAVIYDSTLVYGDSLYIFFEADISTVGIFEENVIVYHTGYGSPDTGVVSWEATASYELLVETPIAFDTVYESSYDTITLTNNSATDIGISDFDIGTGFNLTLGTFSYTVFANDSTLIPIEFIGTSVGSYSDSLVIVHDGDNSPSKVYVSGYWGGSGDSIPTILAHPTDQIGNIGDTVQFIVQATNEEGIGYQWWRDPYVSELESKVINESGHIWGATNDTLTIVIESADETGYVCEVYNPVNPTTSWVKSNAAQLTIYDLTPSVDALDIYALDADYYVDPLSGNDGNAGTSEALAWKTISYAISQVSGGDVVEVLNTATITSPITFTSSGSSDNFITFRATDTDSKVNISTYTSRGINFDGNDYIRIAGFNVTAKYFMNMGYSEYVQVYDCKFQHYDTEDYATYSGNPIVNMNGASYCILQDSWIQANRNSNASGDGYNDMIQLASGYGFNTHHNIIQGNVLLGSNHCIIIANGYNNTTNAGNNYNVQPRWNVIKDNYLYSYYHHAFNFQVGTRNNLIEGNFFERSGTGKYNYDSYMQHDSDLGSHTYGNNEGVTRDNVFIAAGQYDPSHKSLSSYTSHSYNISRVNPHKAERVYNNVFYNAYGLALTLGSYVPEAIDSAEELYEQHKFFNNIFYKNAEYSERYAYASADTSVVIYYHNSGTHSLGATTFTDEFRNNSFEHSSRALFSGDGVGTPKTLAQVEADDLGSFSNLVFEDNIQGDPTFVNEDGWTSVYVSGGWNPTYNESISLESNKAKFEVDTSSSSCYATGAVLTYANGSGSGETDLTVHDSKFFVGGNNPSNWDRIIEGDVILVGSSERKILSIDYSTHVLTLNRSTTWADSAEITLSYSGSGLNIGLLNLASDTTTIAEGTIDSTIWGDNEITNWSFETNLTGWSNDYDGGFASTSRSTAQAVDGSSSARLQGTAQSQGFRSPTLTFTEGDSVQIIYHVYITSGTVWVVDNSSKLGEWMESYTTTGSWVSDTLYIYVDDGDATPDETIGESITFIQGNSGSSDFYIDAIEVRIKQ